MTENERRWKRFLRALVRGPWEPLPDDVTAVRLVAAYSVMRRAWE